MALAPPVIFSALQAARASGVFPLLGRNFDTLALALASGVSQWAVGQPQNLALLGAVTGVAGSGVVNPVATRLIVPPSVPVMYSALVGAGMLGPAATSLATVVATAISSSFSTAGQFTGPVAGVSNGVSAAVFTVANGTSLAGILSGTLPAFFGFGPAAPILIRGLSQGIAGVLLTGTGTGQVVGAPTPVPPVPAATVAIHVVI